MNIREQKGIAGISTPNTRMNGSSTGLDIYATASKATYTNHAARGIPVISQDELKHLRYRSDAKKFDEIEKNQVRNFEDRERRIKDLDTGMSPFMKNQNDHFQRLQRSVARQEQIVSQYESGKQTNFAKAEANKDNRIGQLSSLNMQRKDVKVSNAIQSDDFRRKNDNMTL